ncbi:MAG: phosphoenolpyruvate carboxykinase (ATP) [Crocinitomicaceae bacterium]|nr:phosphoenolpyruvate carboxykinase (ATP) [Crocinitomicaceae bacterium]
MKISGKLPDFNDLSNLGIKNISSVHWNLTTKELTKITINNGMGILASSGALCVKTGKFTGRSPKDRFIVKDNVTKDTVWWGEVNIPFDTSDFNKLYQKAMNYLKHKEIYVRDVYACSLKKFQLKIRVINEYPWSNHFVSNMFNDLKEEEIKSFVPQWHIINIPGFQANPESDGTRQANFSIINFSKKIILIGGTGYTGEIKKGIFSVLNYILPRSQNTLSMHCSANIGKKGDTAVFFGLSGTGKTTLSADPDRFLIGDDEHGWSENTIFNFEGGCYAKCIDLSKQKEPEIWDAIKEGAILENVVFKNNSHIVDFTNGSITENTRVSYPLTHIKNIAKGYKGDNLKNIFLLTADAFGVLPPISKLNKGQAMYHFISGYTAKVAGTEDGIIEPVVTFSACFGSPFLPLHPIKYAEMLGNKMESSDVNVWLVNTGWTKGPYGVGERMKLSHTRAMIMAALNNDLDNVEYEKHPIFGLNMPVLCPQIPSSILNPINTWKNKEQYVKKACFLADKFNENFKKYEKYASNEIINAMPKNLIEHED